MWEKEISWFLTLQSGAGNPGINSKCPYAPAPALCAPSSVKFKRCRSQAPAILRARVNEGMKIQHGLFKRVQKAQKFNLVGPGVKS